MPQRRRPRDDPEDHRPSSTKPPAGEDSRRGDGRGGGRGRGGGGRSRGNAGRGGRGAGGRMGTGRRNDDEQQGGRGGRGRDKASAGRGGGRGRQPDDSGTRSNGGRGRQQGREGRGLGTTISKQNGEKGAEVHTVKEMDRIYFSKILVQFREGEETRMEFPSTLTNTERKFIHLRCSQLGLVSKSTGKDSSRRIAVSKPPQTIKNLESSGSLPTLTVGDQGISALQKHLKAFPPTRFEELESKETGASLVHAFGNQVSDENEEDMVATLRELGLEKEQRHELEEFKPRHVDLNRRKARHAAYQEAKQKSPNYSAMMTQRRRLPAYCRRQEIIDTVARSPVTIIQGETGCGKSTQVCQCILGELMATTSTTKIPSCPPFGWGVVCAEFRL